MLHNRKILLAVSGGIAAYKACELVRLLMKNGASVQVAMTAAAKHFINPLTFEALSGRRVALDLFAGEEAGYGHLDLVRNLDLMVIAPATANIIGKLANGIADDIVSTAALALSCPLMVCPAMNPRMYESRAVQDNLTRLKDRGVQILDPEVGLMAHPAEEPGIGRLPEPNVILDRICRLLPPGGLLTGITITVTAGPTQEALDPIRIITNPSSGRMGYAIAEEARRRGASVHLVSGPGELENPPGISVTPVTSTNQMREAVTRQFDDSRVLIMAAAPTDFRPRQIMPQKLKKETVDKVLTLELEKTEDILKEAGNRKGNRVLVGFALETEKGLQSARRKLKEKKLDLIVLNHPDPGGGAGLGKEAVEGTLITAGEEEALPVMSKPALARIILDRVQHLLTGANPAANA